MNFDFDFRSFQTEAQKRLAKIYSESNEILENDPIEIIDETYNKVQKILDCPEMEKSHPYLYSLDLENVSEDDREKIDKIYDLGVQRGVLDAGDACDDECTDDCDDDSPLCGGPDDALTNQVPVPQDAPKQQMSNFTVLYSGMKDGQIKTGEFYSQTTDIESAKDDCLTQMTAAGYSKLRILAIEQNVCGVNADVKEEPAGVNYYDVYKEDDSEDFEKQETGDKEDGTKKDDEGDSSDNDTEETTDDSSDKDTENQSDDTDDDDASSGDDESKESNSENSDDSEDEEDSTDGKETDDGSSEEDSDDKKDDDEEDSDDKKDDDEEELPAEQKALYKDEYEKLFKQSLKKLKIGKSVQDMDISDKTKFWTEISKRWSKADPSRFLSDKEQERLNKIVVKQDERIV